MNKPLIIISGPTASGKSSLGVRLARDLGGEIISADSMQVYKYMDIGTAKITKEEMQGVPHHMLDVADPHINYSIADYKTAAKKCLEDILNRGKLPIVVGGTGFYIHALLYDTNFDESETDGAIRARLEQEAKVHGAEEMYKRLCEIDPESSGILHMNDHKRVLRALEFYEITGYRISEHNRNEKEKIPDYNYIYFALNRDRSELYPIIEQRVDEMFDKGLVDEINSLKQMGLTLDNISMQGIGYKELFEYDDIELAKEAIKLNSRHYAKRQYTWLRHEKDITWAQSPVSEEDYSWILKKCTEILE